jgi:hypothetical protein
VPVVATDGHMEDGFSEFSCLPELSFLLPVQIGNLVVAIATEQVPPPPFSITKGGPHQSLSLLQQPALQQVAMDLGQNLLVIASAILGVDGLRTIACTGIWREAG